MGLGLTKIKVMHGREDEIFLALKNTLGVKEVHHIIGESPFLSLCKQKIICYCIA